VKEPRQGISNVGTNLSCGSVKDSNLQVVPGSPRAVAKPRRGLGEFEPPTCLKWHMWHFCKKCEKFFRNSLPNTLSYQLVPSSLYLLKYTKIYIIWQSNLNKNFWRLAPDPMPGEVRCPSPHLTLITPTIKASCPALAIENCNVNK